ncbi:hypothetical protein AURDEDRAFT_155545 [Auricularia subglabra TFB-10046 SS5]|nr:hypothetical protein AURDEDRAFT_155545 [Auricularia subglabra TFB-10046 SS5]
MRVAKAFLAMMPLKLVWIRITSSKVTVTFFLLALVHCLVQIALEVFAFSINARALDLLQSVVHTANSNIQANSIAIWNDRNLTVCEGVPSDETCQVVWRKPLAQAPAGSAQTPEAANVASTPVQQQQSVPVQSVPDERTTLIIAPTPAPAPASSETPVPSQTEAAASTATEIISSAASASSSGSSSSTATLVVPPQATSVVTITPAEGDEEEDSDDEDGVESDDDSIDGDSDSDDEEEQDDLGDDVPATAPVAPVSTAVGGVPSAPAVARRFIDSHRKPGSLYKRDPIAEDVDDFVKRAVQRVDMNGQFLGVLITDSHLTSGSFLANPTCINTLQVPIQSLKNSRRVDFTFVAFQVWVLGMSIVALLNESVPHIVAAFTTHVLATVWSGYQIHLTEAFREQFNALVTTGPCGSNLLPEYWTPRRNTEISIAVLNVVVLFAIGFFSYKLLKQFGWQTFKKIGASFVINRCYRLVLAFSIAVQLSVFFIGADIALWLDQLVSGTFGQFGAHRQIFKGVYIGFLVFLFPWLTIGWFSVRRESRVWMGIFLGSSFVMIGCWAAMFADKAFMWTIRTWDFFTVMTVVAGLLLAATLALGIACRLNFGKGLPGYLNQMEIGNEPAWEPAHEKISPYAYDDDEEKLVQFPSTQESPIPTFSAAFGGPEGLERLRSMQAPMSRPAPGISMHARGGSNGGSMDFQSGLPSRPNAVVTITRSVSTSSRSTVSPTGQQPMMHNDSRLGLARINTSDSQRSYRSQRSAVSQASANSATRMNRQQRWQIE